MKIVTLPYTYLVTKSSPTSQIGPRKIWSPLSRNQDNSQSSGFCVLNTEFSSILSISYCTVGPNGPVMATSSETVKQQVVDTIPKRIKELKFGLAYVIHGQRSDYFLTKD